ncbi:hypothetical protein Micbo1qcDRAFT_66120 [Microdochium bolleyi]|uniref:Uncharacterized protein n=1 Tax=Microdochium bolleyi TaxID=196109 RepID=A0A136J365_9PEZI|nr:hypothetical protein Micbo1qcDRAFT_66120 [Microdochium bolleyi]
MHFASSLHLRNPQRNLRDHSADHESHSFRYAHAYTQGGHTKKALKLATLNDCKHEHCRPLVRTASLERAAQRPPRRAPR